MAGYLLVPHGKVDATYDAGFSMYVAAWPLLKDYPGQEFQSGLFGTWMFARHDGPRPKDRYSDIEGGLGWWRDTRFATETPKFIMGGVALNFGESANGPGAGKGRDWKRPAGHYAVAHRAVSPENLAASSASPSYHRQIVVFAGFPISPLDRYEPPEAGETYAFGSFAKAG
jgi:hypothetical protein